MTNGTRPAFAKTAVGGASVESGSWRRAMQLVCSKVQEKGQVGEAGAGYSTWIKKHVDCI